MKKIIFIFTLLAATFPAMAYQNGNLKLSLWDRTALAIPANTQDISGLDFGIGSKTDTVTGLQWDLVWAETQYELKGLSTAWLVSLATKVQGVQLAAFVKGADIVGAQIGAVNLTDSVTGVQVGFFNQANYIHGVQLGFVNYAREIDRGVQIGFVNVAENGFLPVMVFANGRF